MPGLFLNFLTRYDVLLSNFFVLNNSSNFDLLSIIHLSLTLIFIRIDQNPNIISVFEIPMFLPYRPLFNTPKAPIYHVTLWTLTFRECTECLLVKSSAAHLHHLSAQHHLPRLHCFSMHCTSIILTRDLPHIVIWRYLKIVAHQTYYLVKQKPKRITALFSKLVSYLLYSYTLGQKIWKSPGQKKQNSWKPINQFHEYFVDQNKSILCNFKNDLKSIFELGKKV